MLNARLRNILRELMAEQSPVSSTYLANVNKVTPRTTREDIKRLNQIISSHGAVIESIMGKGYLLKVKNDNEYKNFLHGYFIQEIPGENGIPRSPEERIKYIINRLLLQDGYIKLEGLADEIFISKPTIQTDIKEVRKILANYQLTLDSRPNYGLKVEGNELNRRFCMSEYTFDRSDPVTEVNVDGMSDSTLEVITEIILEEVTANHITLSDIAMKNLAIHILIAYKRSKDGYYIQLVHQDLLEIYEQPEYEVALLIVNKIEEAFRVSFPDTETAYIAMHLLGTKMMLQPRDIRENVMDSKISSLVEVALAKVEEKLQLGIHDDQELVMALYLHLKPAINRFKYGMNIRNPMLEDIKRNYPLAFEAGVIAGLEIEEKTKAEIDENEVGYLALHIGSAIERRNLRNGPKRCLVVCASGLGTSQLIYYKLKSTFGQHLDIVGTTEYYQLHQFNLQNIDFVVSSIPIPETLPVQVVEVNAILGEQDISKIEELVLGENQVVDSYLAENLTFIQEKNLHTKEEVLTFMAQRLDDLDLVEAGFIEAVREREEVAPTAFGNLVAIPHPITPKTDKTFIAICTLDKPITWVDKPVQFVCMLCVKKDSQEDLQAMYKWLGKIIDNRSVVQRLLKAKTFEELRESLLLSEK
ncbi:BglG family transcription antiterminator [Gracilibacillus sp. S3-1-1]|uniref:BglG family transcription antiterminator n=1 Tax=Gracilibacillus pellucidus TaxID=3095368 RepID=A0ACC6M3S7_9BACI|nr:BglG family transcription antiterminator [Gracilibacillus sp. S3-1-1]MDX8045558.1 BglG family transcription antiterminator [Gracilibacillus sp. S3-1-1]